MLNGLVTIGFTSERLGRIRAVSLGGPYLAAMGCCLCS